MIDSCHSWDVNNDEREALVGEPGAVGVSLTCDCHEEETREISASTGGKQKTDGLKHFFKFLIFL